MDAIVHNARISTCEKGFEPEPAFSRCSIQCCSVRYYLTSIQTMHCSSRLMTVSVHNSLTFEEALYVLGYDYIVQARGEAADNLKLPTLWFSIIVFTHKAVPKAGFKLTPWAVQSDYDVLLDHSNRTLDLHGCSCCVAVLVVRVRPLQTARDATPVGAKLTAVGYHRWLVGVQSRCQLR